MKQEISRKWASYASALAVLQTIVPNVAIQGINISTGMITARALAPSGRGTLAVIIMWPQLLAYTLTLGTPLSYIYYSKNRPDLSRELSGAAIMLSLASGAVGSCIGWFLVPISLKTYPPDIVHMAQKMVFLAPTGVCALVLMTQVQAAGSFVKYNLFRFFSPLTVLGGIVLLWATHSLNPTNAGFVYLLGGLPALVWLAYLVWLNQRPRFAKLVSTSRLLLHYGLRAWGADLLGTIASQIDRVIVVQMLTPNLMGLYVIAQSAAAVLGVIPNAIIPVVLPKLAGQSNTKIIQKTGAVARITLVLMISAGIPLLLMGKFLLNLAYGTKFAGSAALLPFLIVEAVLDGVTAVLSQAFLAAGYPGIVTLLQGCGLLSAVPLIYLLIPRFGIKGAACALMLATGVRFAFIVANFPLRFKSRPPSLLIGRKELMTFIRTRQLVMTTDDL